MRDAGTTPYPRRAPCAARRDPRAACASNVRVFGSVARGEASERGDPDFLVDRDPDRSLLDLGGLLMDPRELLSAEVAVITEKRSPGVFVAWSSTRPRRL